MLAQQFAHEPDATNVLIAVFLAESESLAQMRADHVAIEHLDGPAAPLQFWRHQASKGGLAGTWKPGKPDGKTAVSSKCLHTLGPRNREMGEDCSGPTSPDTPRVEFPPLPAL